MLLSVHSKEPASPSSRSIHELRKPTKDETLPQSQSMRNVRFSECDLVVDIAHISDLSEEEVHSVWYTRNDLACMRAVADQTILFIENGFPIPPEEDSQYGLETQEGTDRRLQAVEECRAVVMRVQNSHCTDGDDDDDDNDDDDDDIVSPEDIAAAYLDCTSMNTWEANYRALCLAAGVSEDLLLA